MRIIPWIMLIALLAGCMETGCLSCDDGNPCTSDRCVEGKCVHTPLEGPVWGCYSTGGCIEYGCFSGQCLPQEKVECCGNGECSVNENYSNCPRDCKPTCFDGIKNQGEDEVDCGGPCPPCEWSDVNYLRKIGYLRSLWYGVASNYTEAIKAHNDGLGDEEMVVSAMESYSDAEAVRNLLSKSDPPQKYAKLAGVLNDTVSLHMDAVHDMILNLKFHDDKYRLDSNRLFSDALASDRVFVTEYNGLVDEANILQAKCSNFVLDPGEESVDCGPICRTPCDVVFNVTKYIVVRSEGNSAHIVLNVSSPAVDYPPMQKLLGYRVHPIPDSRQQTGEGNLYYVYDFSMPDYGVREFEITQTVKLRKLPSPVDSESDYFSPIYLLENNNSQMTEDICFRADALKSQSRNMTQTTHNIHDWMSKNINYEANTQELGAVYCMVNLRGACDEQADLFVSLTRCDGVPSRRITGSIINASQITGHAWAEYYDGRSWVYIDPSVKNALQAQTADNRHLTSCIGEGAYDCGVQYSYTYNGNKPKIDVKEQVYMS